MNDDMQEIALDGVIYACLRHAGADWLLGSVNPAWQAIIAGIGENPSQDDLDALARQGIWLGKKGPAPRLAAACCGLGSGWPGMGRALYDDFPEARRAMNRLADLAGWDLLGLLDEDDLESISGIRKQIPYLFLLEYAQWSQFASLGFKPSLVCGHSLGELVALHLAGVYDEKAAWLLFEKRAEHIIALEKKLAQETGMLAIHADDAVIRETLAQWPSLALANRNTPRQFIVGGPKEDLLLARKSLRKRRIPALLLNVPLAFHNPAMRILRDFSYRRLRGLEMRAPRIPVLSNVTCGFYPAAQDEICRYIIDLDENAVDWIGCVETMRESAGIDAFLELGPSHTLSGLIEELSPGLATITTDRRDAETDAMRAACARLFSLGALDFASIAAQKQARAAGRNESPAFPASHAHPAPDSASKPSPEAQDGQPPDDEARKIIALLAEATGKKPEAISFDLDLRIDLGMRSSSFPSLIQKAEAELGLHAEYENLLLVNTVGDLTAAMLGRPKKTARPPHAREARAARLPLRRFAPLPDAKDGEPSLLRYGQSPRRLPKKGDAILLVASDPELAALAWRGLDAFGATLAMPEHFPSLKKEALQSRIEIIALSDENGDLAQLPSLAKKRLGRLDGIFIVQGTGERAGNDIPARALLENFRKVSPQGWGFCLRRFGDMDARKFLAEFSAWRDSLGIGDGEPAAGILDGAEKLHPDEIGDLAALELAWGEGSSFWAREKDFRGVGGLPQLFAKARDFPLLMPNREAEFPGAACRLENAAWFSRYADPDCATTPEKAGGWGKVRESRLLAAMLQGSQKLLPWLEPLGFSDIRFYAPVEIRDGLVRECRLECRSMFWLMHEKKYTRLVNCGLAARRIGPDGRRLNEYAPAAEGICYLAAEAARPEAAGDYPQDAGTPIKDAGAGIAGGGRLVASLEACSDLRWRGELQLPARRIAMGEKGVYGDFLQMFDGLLDAARLAIAGLNQDCGSFARWVCTGAGYLNFNNLDYPVLERERTGHLRFFLQLVWRSRNFMRFNGQTVDDSGRPLLVAHNIELEKS